MIKLSSTTLFVVPILPGIKSLQCILLKICLLLGVRFYSGVEFLEIQQPDPQIGWHAKLNPSDHPLNLYEFDVLVGADGARKSRVPGFDRKELRGKLALAVTANFKNYYTREEAAVQEISGVAFIFNQKFFKVGEAGVGGVLDVWWLSVGEEEWGNVV